MDSSKPIVTSMVLVNRTNLRVMDLGKLLVVMEGFDRDGKEKREGMRESVTKIHCVFNCQKIKLIYKKPK